MEPRTGGLPAATQDELNGSPTALYSRATAKAAVFLCLGLLAAREQIPKDTVELKARFRISENSEK